MSKKVGIVGSIRGFIWDLVTGKHQGFIWIFFFKYILGNLVGLLVGYYVFYTIVILNIGFLSDSATITPSPLIGSNKTADV